MGLKYLPFIPARWHKKQHTKKHAARRAFFVKKVAAEAIFLLTTI